MLPYVSKAVGWIDNFSVPGGGIATTSRDLRPYPEVTGYFIPNLLAMGLHDKAFEWGRYLLSIQLADGSFRDPAGSESYAFDTGQIVRGLNALARLDPQYEQPIVRAVDWLITNSSAEGRLPTPQSMSTWSMGERGAINEAVHLFCLPAVAETGELLGNAAYRQFARLSRDYYIKHGNVTDFSARNALTHLYCYIQEALFDLGAHDVAARGMQALAQLQRANGMVPAYSDVQWVCAPGQFQAAITWFKLGERERGMRAFDFMVQLQNASGGFLGSYGVGANYFADAEIAWPIKFMFDAIAARDGAAVPLAAPATLPAARSAPPAGKTLEANLAPDEWHESITRGTTPATVANSVRQGKSPQWVMPIMDETVPGDRVLELGSGTGELSAYLARAGRATALFDFSQGTLDFASRVYQELGVNGQFTQGDVLKRLPFGDRTADIIWSSGLLEHFTDDEIAHIIKESARVANKRVISLVPNANSLPYRLGKDQQERSGRWIWGKEDPKATLEPVFRQAGLHRIREYSIAPEHALTFMDAPELQPLRAEMAKAYAALPAPILQSMNQGYLLVTIGEVDAEAAPAEDPELERMTRYFDETAYLYSATIPSTDGRVQAIFAEVGQARRVLDAGCGKGRYASALKQHFPAVEVHASDLSPEMLRHVPTGIQTKVATIQELPYPDQYFDLVYCVEALEHVPDPQAALNEMARILAPGGRMVIIDKNNAMLGALEIQPWERWFDVEGLCAQMASAGVPAQARFVSHNDRPADGLFVAWCGVKAAGGSAAPLPAGDVFEHSIGMQLIAQLLRQASVPLDVADVAAGHGQLLRKLRADGHRVSGVEADPARVAANADLGLLAGQTEALPLADASADVVLSLQALGRASDPQASLRESARLLRAGGLLCIQVPGPGAANGVGQRHQFSPDTLRTAVQAAGLEVLNLWMMAHLVGGAEDNLFLIAKQAGSGGAAARLAHVFASLAR